MSSSGDFGNPLRKFKLVFLGEQSGELSVVAIHVMHVIHVMPFMSHIYYVFILLIQLFTKQLARHHS